MTAAKEGYWFCRVALDLIDHSSFPKMPGNYAKVYLYVCSRMNFKTFISKVSVRKISEKTGCSQTTIIQALRFFEELGAITITRHGRRASDIEIIKRFGTPSPVECSSATEHRVKKQIRSISGRFAPAPRNIFRSSLLRDLLYRSPPLRPPTGGGRPDIRNLRPDTFFLSLPKQSRISSRNGEMIEPGNISSITAIPCRRKFLQ
ncbi:MAG: hypothetical protein PHE62_11480, partial [Acidobacteriota bacterium]|nr:hypothetical protein [Acidobacteriota bacterium]